MSFHKFSFAFFPFEKLVSLDFPLVRFHDILYLNKINSNIHTEKKTATLLMKCLIKTFFDKYKCKNRKQIHMFSFIFIYN